MKELVYPHKTELTPLEWTFLSRRTITVASCRWQRANFLYSDKSHEQHFKIKRKQGWRTEPRLVPSTQLTTEGGNQVRLARKGKARFWKVANVIPKCFNITFIGNRTGVRHKHCCYNLGKLVSRQKQYWGMDTGNSITMLMAILQKEAFGSVNLEGKNAQASIPPNCYVNLVYSVQCGR